MSWRVVELPERPLLTCATRAGQSLILSLDASGRRSRFVTASLVCGDICRSIPYGASIRQVRWRSERGSDRGSLLGKESGRRVRAKTIVAIAGDRGFESRSLQRRVSCEPECDQNARCSQRAFSHSLGGFRSFIATAANGEVAPIPAVRSTTIEPQGSTQSGSSTQISSGARTCHCPLLIL
jgi:hypothetical protein